MKIKVGNNEYNLDGYANINELQKVLLECYQQGRADKYQEITSEYMLLTEKQVAEIRADAIDELVDLMKPCNNCPSYPNECNDTDYFEDCCRTEQSISWEDLRLKAEQLKEKKNEIILHR